MNLDTKEMIKCKILDVQKNVKDFQVYSEKVDDIEVGKTFKDLAEKSAFQARDLQKLLDKYERCKSNTNITRDDENEGDIPHNYV